MTSLDEVRRAVLDHQVPDAAEHQARRLGRLLGPTRRAARALYATGGLRRLLGVGDEDPVAAAALVDGLSSRRRAKLFTAAVGPLGPWAELLWEAGLQQPYTTGPERRAFRAPGDAAVTAPARVQRQRSLAWWAAHWDREPTWIARHGGHVGGQQDLGWLLAAALDHAPRDQADEVAGHLVDQLHGRGVPGAMGRHTVVACLVAERPDLWDEVEALLLGAQRQEGVRQLVLEAVDEAHPDAFARFLRVVAEHGLTRFAATARAAGVWLGEPFEARDRRLLDEVLGRAAPLLADAGAARAAATADDPAEVHLGLWALGTRDARASAAVARGLLTAGDPRVRVVAARHLADVGPGVDREGVLAALADDDERVRAAALVGVHRWRWGTTTHPGALERLLELHRRTPAKQTVPTGTWKPVDVEVDPREVADLCVVHLGGTPPLALRELAPGMTPGGRAHWAQLLARDAGAHRAQLLELVGDRSSYARDVALEALEQLATDPDDAPALEALLTRKSGDLRRGVLRLLLNQADAAALASVERLLAGRANQQAAGRELARELARAGRGGDRARALAGEADGGTPPATAASATRPSRSGALAPPPASDAPPPSADGDDDAGVAPAIGDLVDHDARTPARRPAPPPRDRLDAHAEAATLAVTSLEGWLAEHADLEVRHGRFGGEGEVMLLSDVRWIRRLLAARPWAEQEAGAPLPEVLGPWRERLGDRLTPEALVLATASLEASANVNPNLWGGLGRGAGEGAEPGWTRRLADRLPAGIRDADGDEGRWPVTHGLLAWAAARELTGGAVDALLDLVEDLLAAVPDKVVRRTPSVVDLARTRMFQREVDWRDRAVVTGPLLLAVTLEGVRPEVFDAARRGRLVRAIRFVDEPHGVQASPRMRRVAAGMRGLPDRVVPDRPARRQLPLRLTCRAVDDGVATAADVVELLAGLRVPEDGQYVQRWDGIHFHPLAEATRRARPSDLADFAWLDPLVDRVRDAVLDVELARGELPTPATDVAQLLRTMVGIDRVVQALRSLGREKFVRGYSWGGRDGKKDVLSRLVRVAFPAPGETAQDFATAVGAAGIRPARLVDLAVYAPQWAPFVEHALDRPGLADAVRWLHAHTKDTGWQVDQDVRAEWTARAQEQTPLSAEDLVNGAVDVAWFTRVRATLGDAHFTDLLKAAKYASSAGGHKRAEVFARALRGELDVAELEQRADAKRHQDTVRAIGLVPLPDDPDAARAEVLRRWTWLQQWAKGSRQYGQQRRASEGLAVRIATENLARTAGYADPQRLSWAMEAEAVRDLAEGPLVATAEDVTVTLAIDEDGAPALAVERGGRRLKNVPRKVAKDPAIAELRDRARGLREQARRMRRSLEDAMVRGDAFTAEEFAGLRDHAVLRPMLDRLVVVDAQGTTAVPVRDGFEDADGADVRPRGELRVAHPVDLLASGRWHAWQHRLFTARVRQPCKQVFRELYLPTAAERDDGFRSHRYAGQQVQPSQAAGLLGSRGWVVSPDGEALRTFHDEDVTAHLTVMLGVFGTPAEVEDTTVEDVVFTRRGSWDPLPLAEVPARVFSEAMRDVDLVVSVAHASGWDPEASASTVEVRGAIVRETAELLGLENVETTDHHALVRGTLGNWSIHLGSGTVHKRPGNAICIVPVGSQHRGRVFLPFVDDDPRTAEVVAKVVLLARDDRIRDPAILDQLR